MKLVVTHDCFGYDVQILVPNSCLRNLRKTLVPGSAFVNLMKTLIPEGCCGSLINTLVPDAFLGYLTIRLFFRGCFVDLSKLQTFEGFSSNLTKASVPKGCFGNL